MKRGFIIASGIMLAVAVFMAFVLVGYRFSAVCLACAAVVVFIYGFLIEKRAKKCITALSCVLALGFALFAWLEIPVISASDGDSDVDADYLIVLGAGVNGSVPSLSMVNRLTPTIEYMQSHPDCRAVLTGGQGSGENLSEAQAMFDYLTAHGVDGSRLILEEKATSTAENLQFSFEIIDREAENAVIAVVSSEYHLCRAKEMAKMLGVEVYGIPGHTSYPVLKINYFIREAFGMLHLKVFGL